jgi:uncharacterized protein YndB with AHSA1/START domain
MDKQLKLTESITIHAPAAIVWHALTDKATIKEYFFGTDVKSDWKKGSAIIWSGEWEGKYYEETGNVLEVEENKRLVYNYLSSGKEDKPENYAIIHYLLEPSGKDIHFTVTQENFLSSEAYEHSVENWKAVLAGLKKIAERN